MTAGGIPQQTRLWRQGFRGSSTLFLSSNCPGNRSHQGNSVGVVGEGVGDISFQIGQSPDATASHRVPRRSANTYEFISHTDHKTHKAFQITHFEPLPPCSMCPLWQILFNPSSFAALRLECRRCMQRQTGVRTSSSHYPKETRLWPKACSGNPGSPIS